MPEDRKLPYLPDEVMMKYEIWKQEAEEDHDINEDIMEIDE